ncbi:hypothetical protein M8J77_009346 [Diaphorina citri]|nr:hypothetical protein M8J77_009346 [Diaphorina citri]
MLSIAFQFIKLKKVATQNIAYSCFDTTCRISHTTERIRDTTGHIKDTSGRIWDTSGRICDTSGRIWDTSGRIRDTTVPSYTSSGSYDAFFFWTCLPYDGRTGSLALFLLVCFQASATSLGALLDSSPSDETFTRLKHLVCKLLPENWKEWQVRDCVLEPLVIKKGQRNKIRFAIPTLELFQEILPGEKHVSERKYRKLYQTLLDWPLGRALIFAPREIVQVLRSEEDEEIFLRGIAPLRNKVYSRKEANKILANDSSDSESDIESPCYEPLSPVRRASENDLANRVNSIESKLDTLIHSLGPRAQSGHVDEEDCDSYDSDEECQSLPSLNQVSKSAHVPESVLGQDLWGTLPQSSPDPSSFLCPSTIVKEPEVKDPEPDLLETGLKCQRLGRADWDGVRYMEAEKRLRRGDMFQPLAMNNVFASRAVASDAALRRQERLLGSVTYGLLAQRKAFVDAQTALLAQFPAAAQVFSNCFLGDSAFRSTSDDLLQMVCGKRAEILAERRKLVEPNDPVSKRALHNIPPSSSHVFDEEKLAKLSADPHIKLQRSFDFRGKKRFSEGDFVKDSPMKRIRLSNPRPVGNSLPTTRSRPFQSVASKTEFASRPQSLSQKHFKRSRASNPSQRKDRSIRPF